MITGTTVERLQLQRVNGEPYPVELMHPAASPANIAALRRTAADWANVARDWKARGADEDLLNRAAFAALVAEHAATELHTQPERADEQLLAVHAGDVVGIATYNVQGNRADLAFVTVAPPFLAGAPGDTGTQVRGIGTNMVCTVSADLQRRHVNVVRLSPLDDAAEEFWRRRGFVPVGSDEFEVAGTDGVQDLANACSREPDDPTQGHVCLCGTIEQVQAEIRRLLTAPRRR